MTHFRRIGIVGGTFDPPHIAHMILGEHGFEELDLDRVLYIPAGTPPHKESTRTPAAHRAAITEIAISDNDRFTMSRVDLDRPGPHYTVDTVAILRETYPDAEFTFIMGEDMFKELPQWERA
ncbi:MAG: nicotinate-nucleotide adenylyltransferase, partial [Phototrophicaceae bacterium]